MSESFSLWSQLHTEVTGLADDEPVLTSYLQATVINHESLIDSLSYLLAEKLASSNLPALSLREVIGQVLNASSAIQNAINVDLVASVDRNPASHGLANPFLNHKGFHALEAYRIANYLWQEGRHTLAFYLQSRISEVFAVDIHPAANLGTGIFIDHGTGIVIGETAIVGDNVSILQDVTLGGTGKEMGDRHPKVGSGVLICAGAKVLGNIRIGKGAKIGAGSVVLEDVPPHTTVVGVPAKVVGRPDSLEPALGMDQHINKE